MKLVPKYKLIAFLITALLVCQTSSDAIMDKFKKNKVKNNKATELVVEKPAEIKTSISFDDILTKAIAHSYDIKIADYQALMAAQSVVSARSEYFPKLYLGASTEYNKSFDEARIQSYVGDVYVNPYTRSQSLLGVTLAYNLFDFGVRRSNLEAAKAEVTQKKILEKQQEQELVLSIIDTYTRILILKNQISKDEEILKLLEKNLEMKKRLYDIQELSQLEMNDAVVEVERTTKEIHQLKSNMSEALILLGFYTGEKYDVENIKVEEVAVPEFDAYAFTDYTKTIMWSLHQANIKKKEYELMAAKRANYPKLNVYSRYYLFGSDRNNYFKSYGIQPSNFSVGMSLNMPLFDGLKNRGNINYNKFELEKIKVERDKAMAQLEQRVETMRSNLTYLKKQIVTDNNMVTALVKKDKSLKLLLVQRLVSPIEVNQTKIDLLKNEIEQQKDIATQTAILKGIQTLTEVQ